MTWQNASKSAILIKLRKAINTHPGTIVAPLPLWSCCKLTSGRGEKQKGEFTHGSNFNETTS